MAMSAITVIGTLVAEPDRLGYDRGGKAHLGFRVAINNRYKSGDEWKEDTSFMQCWAHGSLAENISASLGKGNQALIVGTIRQKEWTDDGGQKVNIVGIQVDECGPALKWATALVDKNPRREQ